MKLSLLVPTFNSAETIERTLTRALAQCHRPLEVVVYDEASRDDTRTIVERLLASRPDMAVEVDFTWSDENQGPVKAWRVPLHRATGDWCCFVWADDVLEPDFSEHMMAAAARAEAAGRKLVFSAGQVEVGGEDVDKYSCDEGLLNAVEFSLGIFLRRYSVNQVNGVYEMAAARTIFDRHIQFDNPMGYDYNRYPYGNDVGFLSELAAAGGGVEMVGRRLVRLVLSGGSMTRDALAKRRWQLRWQYIYNLVRVWRVWQDQGMPAARTLTALGERRLALCALFLDRTRRQRTPSVFMHGLAAGWDFWRLDYERRKIGLDAYRDQVQRLGSASFGSERPPNPDGAST